MIIVYLEKNYYRIKQKVIKLIFLLTLQTDNLLKIAIKILT